jgi:hypothetical protein
MSLDGDLSEELTKNPSENLWPSEKRVRVRLNPAPEFLDFDARDVTLSAFDPPTSVQSRPQISANSSCDTPSL